MRQPRILVIYGTTEGHTSKVAAAMARTLRHAGADVDVVNATSRGWDPDPEVYSAVVVAASVHAGTYQAPVRRWVKAHAAALRSRPTAFVSVCLAGLSRSAKTDAHLGLILRRFYEATGWEPTDVKTVAGALPYTKYNWVKRWMMRRIVAKARGDTDTSRDYVYTDWNDLEAFTTAFATRVIPRNRVGRSA